MKKQLALTALVVLALSGLVQTAAKADDVWFSRYDRDHDNHWSWTEFRNANNYWYRHHRHEARLSDAELRAKFDALDAEHHGWVSPDQVRTYHEW